MAVIVIRPNKSRNTVVLWAVSGDKSTSNRGNPDSNTYSLSKDKLLPGLPLVNASYGQLSLNNSQIQIFNDRSGKRGNPHLKGIQANYASSSPLVNINVRG